MTSVETLPYPATVHCFMASVETLPYQLPHGPTALSKLVQGKVTWEHLAKKVIVDMGYFFPLQFNPTSSPLTPPLTPLLSPFPSPLSP